MARLGSRYTVNGYLDAACREAIVQFSSDKLDNISNIIESLPRSWKIGDFVSAFDRQFNSKMWGCDIDRKRSASGEKVKITSMIPDALEIIHNTDEEKCVSWSEKVMTAQAVVVEVKDGKAKFDIFPTSIYVSEHALRRIYERTGGCDYDEFPKLAGNLFEEISEKAHTLFREGIFKVGPNSSKITAIPINGGVAVAYWSELMTIPGDLRLGTTIRLSGRNLFRGAGAFHAGEFWNLPTDKWGDRPISCVPSAFIRTFYGIDEINDVKTKSIKLIDELLKNISMAPLSPAYLMEARKRENGRIAISLDAQTSTEINSSIRKEILDSLYWLNFPENDILVMSYYGQAQKTVECVNDKFG